MPTSTHRPPSAGIDHLVVMATTLDEGVQWCERTLGITPDAGGEHPLMGTHNRIFNLSSPSFPHTYAEIIAIRPGAVPQRAQGHKRWFDMDDPILKAQVAKDGPQLIHFVASVPGVLSAVKALAALGLDRGEAVQASRQTPTAHLQWRITVRSDGQRLFFGGLPTLIQWGDAAHDPALAEHPVKNMAPSGVTLESLHFSHPRPASLAEAYEAIGLTAVPVAQGAPNLVATLQTPRGVVKLESKGH